MSFLWIEMLWALAVVPSLLAAYLLVQRRRRKYAVRYASLSLVKEALGRGPGIRRHVPPALFLIAMATMVFALARPVASVTLPSQQGTVILTVDVSGSMRAEDLKPSRLEAAKAAARAFVEKQLRNIRIGVVSFSSVAAVVQAPTTDREALLAAINRLATQRSTAIGSGILTSLDAIFEQPGAAPTPLPRDSLSLSQPAPAPTPLPRGTYAPGVVVLLSDGQSNTGPNPLQAAKQASDRGVRVFTVGVGSPEGIVLGFEGRSVRVRLDEATLKGIADETDADYFKADSETDLRQIYENLGTTVVFKAEQTELTAGFTGVAAFLLLVAGSLSLLWFNRLP
ncbi:MAG: VWA domain-containing protein [Dehalococcoidia bacterium]|nr:VWA domain-containing protein [Dehalococcoidia bacterium]